MVTTIGDARVIATGPAREAAVARAMRAEQAAHAAAQDGRRVPVLDTSPEYRTQMWAQRRLLPAEVGAARVTAFPGRMMRSDPVRRNGKLLEHLSGYATVFDKLYPMWDEHGPYEEYVGQGAADNTLAADPDVMFLVNHRGLLMARTHPAPGMLPTLELAADKVGMSDDMYVNPQRTDVQDLLTAIDDQLVTEQSFAFMVVRGSWDDDFMIYGIEEFDIHRGDVSAVNFGANPFTSIGARAQELAQVVRAMPAGYARATVEQLRERVDAGRPRVTVGESRHTADSEGEPRSPQVARLAGRIARTTARLERYAAAGDGTLVLGDVALPWYSIRNTAATGEAPADEPATVFIFDEIGGSFGVSAKKFAADLNEITTPVIRVRINSPGGSLFDGLAIMNTLVSHPSRIEVYVDGIAASAASVVALGGNEVAMMPGSQMMIHDASMVVDANPREMAAALEYITRQSQNIADLYAQASRAGGDAAYWRELMMAETWMFAGEAVDLGLADRVVELPVRDAAVTCDGCGAKNPAGVQACQECGEELRMARRHDLTRFQYRYAGRVQAPEPGSRDALSVISSRARSAVPAGGRSILAAEAMFDLD